MAVKKETVDLLKDFKPSTERIKESKSLSPYWVGLSVDCPIEGAHVGSLDFCKKLVKRTGSASGETTEVPQQGKILYLTDDEVKNSLEVLQYAFIRRVPTKYSDKFIYQYRNFHPRARVNKLRDLPNDETDTPLGKYCYIKKLESNDVFFRPFGIQTPPNLISEVEES